MEDAVTCPPFSISVFPGRFPISYPAPVEFPLFYKCQELNRNKTDQKQIRARCNGAGRSLSA